LLIARLYEPKPSSEDDSDNQASSASVWFFKVFEKVLVSQSVTRSKR
jgi:hypothetical protein